MSKVYTNMLWIGELVTCCPFLDTVYMDIDLVVAKDIKEQLRLVIIVIFLSTAATTAAETGDWGLWERGMMGRDRMGR